MKKTNIIHLLALGVILMTSSEVLSQTSDQLGKLDQNNGTAVTLTIGDTVIPATLNNTTTAQDLISKLPYTVQLNRYAHDYCGTPPTRLAYDEKDVQFGWKNGEISYEKQTPYFVIFFGDEDKSQVHGNQVIIGKVDVDLDTIKDLGQTLSITIDKAK